MNPLQAARPDCTEHKQSRWNMIQEIDICDYSENRFDNEILVDLRDKFMFDFGTLPGAINIPIDQIRQLYHLPKDKKICVFCQAGEVSREIAELLTDAGYEAFHLSGGYRKYLSEQVKHSSEEI